MADHSIDQADDPFLHGLGPNMQRMDGDHVYMPDLLVPSELACGIGDGIPQMPDPVGRAVHNSPPPMDDVGGVDDALFDANDPNKPKAEDIADAFSKAAVPFLTNMWNGQYGPEPPQWVCEVAAEGPIPEWVTEGEEEIGLPLGAGDLLKKAAAIVTGDREAQHGPKERNHANIAILWRAYDELRVENMQLGPDTAWDVANKMELLKIARRFCGAGKTNPDNYIDGAGYCAVAGEIALNGSEER